MRLLILAFVVAGASACTQDHVQLPAFYEGGTTSAPSLDAGELDGTTEGSTSERDATADTAAEAATTDAAHEASSDAASAPEGGAEAGPGDAGDG